MFTGWWGKAKQDPGATLATLNQLNETLGILEKKEQILQRKIDAELEQIKKHMKVKNKKGAIHCLKKKKMLETQLEQIGNFQLRIYDQMNLLESAQTTMQTFEALKLGADNLKKESNSIKDVDKIMDDISEEKEMLEKIQYALREDMDDDEFLAELETLETELELLEPVTSPVQTQPAKVSPHKNIPTSPVQTQPAKVSPQKNIPLNEEEETESLSAAMAQLAAQ